MVFPPEREAAYVQRMFGWQGTRLRRLVLFAPVLLPDFRRDPGAADAGAPVGLAARRPSPEAGLVVLARRRRCGCAPCADADLFAWAGVALQTLFLVFCALSTRARARRARTAAADVRGDAAGDRAVLGARADGDHRDRLRLPRRRARAVAQRGRQHGVAGLRHPGGRSAASSRWRCTRRSTTRAASISSRRKNSHNARASMR